MRSQKKRDRRRKGARREDRRRAEPRPSRGGQAGGTGGFRTIRFARRGPVATITLDRPEVLNAYNLAMRDELCEAFGAVAEDHTVRAVVLRGSGPAFGSGGDLREFGTAPSPLVARWVRWRRDVWGMLLSLDAFTIAAVHGIAAGSALEMALLCDAMLVADDARLMLPETALGLIPGVGGTQTLPRAIGVGRALEMVLTGLGVDAREAVRIALANRMVRRRDLDRTAQALARRVAARPRALVTAAKRCVSQGLDLQLAEGLALERRSGALAERL